MSANTARRRVLRVTVSGGAEYRADLLAGHVLLVSGRASFELAQRAIMVGLPVLAAVSAPSSLAASLAEEAGLTLVGFLRGATMNVYAGAQRVTADVSAALAAPAGSGA
jgi:FdhD protein